MKARIIELTSSFNWNKKITFEHIKEKIPETMLVSMSFLNLRLERVLRKLMDVSKEISLLIVTPCQGSLRTMRRRARVVAKLTTRMLI